MNRVGTYLAPLLGLLVLLVSCGPASPTAAPTTPPDSPLPPPSPLSTLLPTAAPVPSDTSPPAETPPPSPGTSPTAVPPPSPTATAEPPALVAYVYRGDLWTYDGSTPQRRTSGGRAYFAQLSPGGRYVLLHRHEPPTEWSAEPLSLWVVDLQAGREMELDLSVLPPIPYTTEDGREVQLPRWPYQTGWLPDGETVLFNTIVDFTAVGPGRAPGDDLWLADARSGEVINVLPEEEVPASFTLSPDGLWVLLNRPNRIEGVRLDTLQRRTLLAFDAVATYSEYAWLPEPHWLPDGRTAHVAIAPADPLASQTYTLWQIGLAGAAVQLGQLEGSSFAWSPNGSSWSGDGSRLAYARGIHQVLLARADGGGGVQVDERQAPEILGWSPSGNLVLFHDGGSLYGIDVGRQESRWIVDTHPVGLSLYWLGDTAIVVTEEVVLQVAPDGSGVQVLQP